MELLTRGGAKKFSHQGWVGQAYGDLVPHKRKALFLTVSLTLTAFSSSKYMPSCLLDNETPLLPMGQIHCLLLSHIE